MTDDPVRRRSSDGRIDKIDHDLATLAANVTGLTTSVALINQNNAFISDTIKRIESGQTDQADRLEVIRTQILAVGGDPLASAAGRAVSARIAAVETDVGANKSAIRDELLWRQTFTAEITGTVRTLRFFATATTVAAAILSIIEVLSRLGH